ncbi:cytochrome P450 [Streptomyces sp. NPDC048484]|uniref:cytochrome P450 n=1 Tax=Streptomyces sp. NPDC048484 TaxID=3155146 RepID=UPI0034499BF5
MTSVVSAEEAEAALLELASPPQPADPYPFYDILQRADKVYWSPSIGIWAITGYDEVYAASRTPNVSNGPRAAALRREDWEDHESLRLFLRAIVTLDPPDHTRVRGLASRVFTPASIKGLRPVIEKLANSQLDDLADKAAGGQPVDLVDNLASPFPVAVISELLGVPADQGKLFYDLANDWTRVWGGFYSDEDLAQANASVKELRNYFSDLLDERRARPREDLLSSLVKEAKDSRLSEDELMALATFLFVSGFETTTNLISSGIYSLINNPDQLRNWRQDPGLTGSAVEELLRHGTPISGTARVITQEVRLGDHDIPPGQLVMLMLAAANRDPGKFPDPHRLDLSRDDGPHLSFGGGAHFCMGGNLARMEAQIIFPALFNRFSTMEVEGTPVWRDAIGLHGFQKLPLVLAP